MQPEAYCFHRSFDPAGPSEFQTDRHYLLYALEGTLRLEADGKRWTLPPARAALICANHPVTITVLSRLTSASVLFSPAFMGPPDQILSVFDMTPLARELVKACREWGPDSGPLSPFATRIFGTLAEVVVHLSAHPSKCVLPMPVSPALKAAVQLTEDRAHDSPTFDEIARLTHQSSRALARRFASEMGMTWREVLRRIRIMNAVEALAMSDAPVTQIALRVGYGSLSGFNAAFRDCMQMSPTEYRASLRR
ncbi:AraC family transcriptional regulator [Roseobacter sp. YSTF-M11]|uniref:AraC family transcriptional regulator n=1 Tax=Roseobacter insulae TaxID=2859783 RepID=A0A9X1FRT0_9RHOB|nr:AraC family transcriptional regulator [Roseobacter insulae]MBW4706599.1 AraC family transcriptional regulator [Roseobacter insulae]